MLRESAPMALSVPISNRYQHDVHQCDGRPENGDETDDQGSHLELAQHSFHVVQDGLAVAHDEIVLLRRTKSAHDAHRYFHVVGKFGIGGREVAARLLGDWAEKLKK